MSFKEKILVAIVILALILISVATTTAQTKYAELVGLSKPNLANISTDRFILTFNQYSDSTKAVRMLQQYPIDALNELSKQGWRLVQVFSTQASFGEIRHYVLSK